jgi:Calcineurin-like phosphoesterase
VPNPNANPIKRAWTIPCLPPSRTGGVPLLPLAPLNPKSIRISSPENLDSLLDSLEKDFNQFEKQTPPIAKPSLSIVSGDLIYGVKLGSANGPTEQKRQYAQAEEFLVGLAERFFERKRERIVILPGNHDVSYEDVMASTLKIDSPFDPDKRSQLVSECFRSNSRLRWSWRDLCFYRIVDEERYQNRLDHFGATYERFYQGKRTFPLLPEQQYGIFDFPDLGFCVAALNSCFNNDPLRRSGAFHPVALTEMRRALGQTRRVGWLLAAAWHHNLAGGPAMDDYLDAEFLQLLIDAGVSLGFHGHQHLSECFDERYRIGPSPRKITIVSASTLCAEPSNLKPGVPRSYNVVELNTDSWHGRVHQRKMVNNLFSMPVRGPGHFNVTNKSYLDFELCKPLAPRPPQLDLQITLNQADKYIGARQWSEALDILETVKEVALARPFLLRAATELGDPRRTIATLWPPLTVGETVTVGGAILESGSRQEAEAFVQLPLVSGSVDASVQEISRRIHERRMR